MKKHIKTRQLNRDSQARRALFRSLVKEMIKHEQIQTTSAKAKAVRSIFEKLITKARHKTLHAQRQLQSYIQDKDLVYKLVHNLAPRYVKVNGGYTRIKAIGNRRGDNAPIVQLSLVKVVQPDKSKPKKPKSKSTKSAGTKKTTKLKESNNE